MRHEAKVVPEEAQVQVKQEEKPVQESVEDRSKRLKEQRDALVK